MLPEWIDPTSSICARVFLAFLLGRSVIAKLRSPSAFRDTVRDYELLPPAAVSWAAAAVIGAEAFVTIGLLLPATHGAGGIGAIALLTLYITAITLNLARGRREIYCGCSGPLARGGGIHEWLVARNLFYIGLAVLAAWPVAARPLTWLDGLTVPFAVSALVALALSIDGLAASAARTRWEPSR